MFIGVELTACFLERLDAIEGFLTEALAQLATLPAGAASALRDYLHGDYVMLYTAVDTDATVYLLSIHHHRELSFDFARLWSGAGIPPSA